MSKIRDDWNLIPFETKEGLTECWLYDECWGCNIHFISDTKSHDVVSAWMKRVFRIPDISTFKQITTHAEAVTIGYADKPRVKAMVIHFPFVWKETFDNILTLVHESLHCTFSILKSKGMKVIDETEEPYCYLQESIIRRLVEAMRKPIIPYPKKVSKITKKKKVYKNGSNRPRIKKP